MKKMKKIALIFSMMVVMLIFIGFSSAKNTERRVHDVKITIQDSQQQELFTDQDEILNLINAENTDYVLSLPLADLDLKQLEERVASHPFIQSAQIYRDLKGNLLISIEQAHPIARIFNRHGPDAYIDSEGNLLPVTAKRTARVPLIELERTMSWEQNIRELGYGEQLLTFIRFISEDAFWNAQIAGFTIQQDGELVLQSQVSKQDIYFGFPDEIESKFKKLKLFYTEILPNKGWNTYASVNVKFKNQIICK